ncbi:MAG TPA: WecB/TagA/CpsF family glycosyltransferase [Gammaproteobacteria bacterium]|nr:WecB/TagA/CpsF family glycosyltransferase [Gammaproteobacteria bacterium]
MNEHCNVCNFPISPGTLTDNFSEILHRAEQKLGGWVVTLNTEMLAKTCHQPEYRELLKKADLFLADGMPIVWAAKLKNRTTGKNIKERSTGVDLVEHFLSLEHIPDFAIIGGVSPEVTLKRYPGATAACKFLFKGKVDGSESQLQQFAREIDSKNINIVFLALGIPKQDQIAEALRQKIPGAVYIGVGGTFEILSPAGSRAPGWMQKNGLEWLFRFGKEPKRLWKRYFIQYPMGVYLLVKDCYFG